MNKIFISYRRADSDEICGRIYDRLSIAFGKENVFKDVDIIPGGVDFRQAIGQALNDCKAMVVVIGPHWIGASPNAAFRLAQPNDYVRIEVEHGLLRRIPILPILVRQAQMPDVDDVAPS